MPTPPFSLIEPGESDSVTTGADSSSVIVSVTAAGASAPESETVPETVTVLSGASTGLSIAVIVTVPLLRVAFAAKLKVVPSSSKSPATAGDTASANTVTVNACHEAGDAVAVTVPTPPFSLIEPGESDSVTTGADSSSVIVSVTADGASAPESETVPETVTVLSGASTGLSIAVIVDRTGAPRGVRRKTQGRPCKFEVARKRRRYRIGRNRHRECLR